MSVNALPGLWRERGGLDRLVKLDAIPATPGMVQVARADENWRDFPEKRWQAWPEDLELTHGHSRVAGIR